MSKLTVSRLFAIFAPLAIALASGCGIEPQYMSSNPPVKHSFQDGQDGATCSSMTRTFVFAKGIQAPSLCQKVAPYTGSPEGFYHTDTVCSAGGTNPDNCRGDVLPEPVPCTTDEIAKIHGARGWEATSVVASASTQSHKSSIDMSPACQKVSEGVVNCYDHCSVVFSSAMAIYLTDNGQKIPVTADEIGLTMPYIDLITSDGTTVTAQGPGINSLSLSLK